MAPATRREHRSSLASRGPMADAGRWVRPARHTAGHRGNPHQSRPTGVDRLRNGIITTTATLYGKRAPLVDALDTNRRVAAMDPQLTDAYAKSGLVHILSISGFHVGLIAAWLYLLGRFLRFSRSRRHGTRRAGQRPLRSLLGWPAPATRAAGLVVLLPSAGCANDKSNRMLCWRSRVSSSW